MLLKYKTPFYKGKRETKIQKRERERVSERDRQIERDRKIERQRERQRHISSKFNVNHLCYLTCLIPNSLFSFPYVITMPSSPCVSNVCLFPSF